MKWGIIVLLILGLIAAASAAVLMGTIPVLTGKNAEDSKFQVLVAARDLGIGKVVDVNDIVEIMEKDARGLPKNYFTNTTQAVGKMLGVSVFEGQPIEPNMFSVNSAVLLASQIPHGKEGFIFQVPRSSFVKGLMPVGSYVNILCSYDLKNKERGQAISHHMFYDIKLLAIGEDVDGKQEEEKKSGKSNSNLAITLAVTYEQAQELQLALQKGSIQLTLRNPNDRTVNKVDPTILNESKFIGDIMDLIGESGSETGGTTTKKPKVNKQEAEESKDESKDNLQIDELKTQKRRFWKVDMILGQKRKELNFPIDEDPNE